MKTTGVILMTALVPTKGHAALIKFAANMCDRVHVIISTRSHEPTAFFDRFSAFVGQVPSFNVNFLEHRDDDAPQNPETEQQWDYWRRVVQNWHNLYSPYTSDPAVCPTGTIKYDFLFASEPYGKKMAEVIGAEFIPFDIGRRMIDVKGTTVRHDLIKHFGDILPNFQLQLQKQIVLFGQESVGKSTMTKMLNEWYGNTSYMTHEFARPYLEFKDDKTVTDWRMDVIANGQIALEKTIPWDRPFVFLDTDILSTIGYYRIYQGKEPQWLSDRFRAMDRKDLYVVMNDQIPFVADPLRYGGDVRESTRQFWVDLLEEYDCNYYLVQNTRREDQKIEIAGQANNCFWDNYACGISTFERD